VNKKVWLLLLFSLLVIDFGTLQAVKDFDKKCLVIVAKTKVEIDRQARIYNYPSLSVFCTEIMPKVDAYTILQSRSLVCELYKEKIVTVFSGNYALIGAAFLQHYSTLCPTQKNKMWKPFPKSQRKQVNDLFNASQNEVVLEVGRLMFTYGIDGLLNL
jgi:hypothetical protein